MSITPHVAATDVRVRMADVASDETLEAAWTRVRGRSVAAGLDNQTVEAFDANSAVFLATLKAELLDSCYVPVPLKRIGIPKPAHPGEVRAIGMPALRDKIAQEAVRSVLEPLAERLFLNSSYGYRPGKGATRAIGRVRHHLTSRQHHFVARADIDNCFDSLPRDGVLSTLTALGADEGIVRLVTLWLSMGSIDWRGRWHDVTGVPQGSVVAPLLCNLYLHALDQRMAPHEGYVRYADDILITAASTQSCDAAVADLVDAAHGLGLSLNEAPTVRPVNQGFEFLGMAFTHAGLALPGSRMDRLRSEALRVAGTAERHTPKAIETLAHQIDGWRHYYGALLTHDRVAPLDALAADAWVALLRVCRQCTPPLTRPGAATLLAGAQGVVARPPAALAMWRRMLVDRAWRNDVSGAARARATMKPSGGSHTPHVRSVDATVRARKRTVLRRVGARSELVVTTDGAFVGKHGNRIVVRCRGQVLAESSIETLHAVTLASGGLAVSADALTLCSSHGVPVVFLDARESVEATVQAPGATAARASALQATTRADSSRAVDLAKRFVDGKLRNQGHVLKSLRKYSGRSREACEATDLALRVLEAVRGRARTTHADCAEAIGQLFAAEGQGAQAYWTALEAVLPPGVAFPGRQHQGARDITNSLLNYGYAVLKSRVYLALLKAGLNPAISFLHSPHRTDPTLVYDLVEEFRAPFVDRTVVAMLNRREVLKTDADGRLDLATRRRLLERLHARLATIVRFRGHEMTLGDVVDTQARGIVAHLEERATYRPYAATW